MTFFEFSLKLKQSDIISEYFDIKKGSLPKALTFSFLMTAFVPEFFFHHDAQGA